MLSNLLALATIILSASVAASPMTDPELVAQLRMKGTQLDRLSLLSKNSDWVFNFAEAEEYKKDPGSVVTAGAANWPAVIGNGMAMAYITLAPCAMLPVHFHPRAVNYVVAVKGATRTYFFQENGGKLITNDLTPGIATIFPQGSLHTMYNYGCTEAILISALNNEDPGTLTFANTLFEFPLESINNAFGSDLGRLKGKVPPIGSNAIAGSKECLKRCRNTLLKPKSRK